MPTRAIERAARYREKASVANLETCIDGELASFLGRA
jgi:hypothetical protein